MPPSYIPASLLALALSRKLQADTDNDWRMYEVDPEFLIQHPLSLYSDIDNSTEEVRGLYLEQNRDKDSGVLTFTLHAGTVSFYGGEHEITAENHAEFWFVSSKPHPLLANIPHIPPSSLAFLERGLTSPCPVCSRIELTPTETHTLLSQIAPTVPIELISQWSLPLSLSACPEWPEPYQETLYRYSVSYTPKTLDSPTPQSAFLSHRNLTQSTPQPLQTAPQFETPPSLPAVFFLKFVLSSLPTSWHSYYFHTHGTTSTFTYLPVKELPFPQALNVFLQYEIPFHKTYLQYLPTVSTTNAPHPSDSSSLSLETLLQHVKPDYTQPFYPQLNNCLQILSKMAQEIEYNAISC